MPHYMFAQSWPDQIVISALTAIAGNSAADPVPTVSSLLDSIASTEDQALLACWCLLDSVVRNVGGTFIAHISRSIPMLMAQFMGSEKTKQQFRVLVKVLFYGFFCFYTLGS